jgi:hypothetical protein
MKRIVISQPFYLPWVGLFEQVRLADVFVHFDDVQFPLGRQFINRVEVKTPTGAQWLTVPVLRHGLQLINEVVVSNTSRWRDKHRKTLQYNYARAPYVNEMMEIVDSVFALKTDNLAEINIYAIERISAYFGLSPRFCLSSSYGIKSSSSAQVLELMQRLDGNVLIEGHGAKNFLDHDLLERNGVSVEYMRYERAPYPQLHGAFDPHVTILDLIANTGRAGVEFIRSGTTHWRDFIHDVGND